MIKKLAVIMIISLGMMLSACTNAETTQLTPTDLIIGISDQPGLAEKVIQLMTGKISPNHQLFFSKNAWDSKETLYLRSNQGKWSNTFSVRMYYSEKKDGYSLGQVEAVLETKDGDINTVYFTMEVVQSYERWIINRFSDLLIVTGLPETPVNQIPREGVVHINTGKLFSEGINEEEFADSILFDNELGYSISNALGVDETRELKIARSYLASISRISSTAWESAAFQYLLRQKSNWHDPRVKSVAVSKVDNDIIRGTLRLNLLQGTGVFDKPAYLEFEALNTEKGWIFSNFGSLVIEKSMDYEGNYVNYDEDIAASIDNEM